ncbi:DUF4157 domain-containing protein [Halobacterium salinarum]|uniref:eCIS core domain-containing protein n=1 Tax=Halobacterium salinarum TaxID=2242 RepID=UPI002556D865|nr:DUF4157 domain-containing protein [Halobacterium salinarum]MDL0124467.1 DUF4157 domain-containing protein [Halobacterium salinarum]
MEIEDPAQAGTLQRLAESNGTRTVREWADEGIPIDAMGNPKAMDAYRNRQGTPVPWDAERRNKRSKRRSKHIQRFDGGKPAGDTQVPDSVRDVISSPGQSLDASVQRAMEDRMDHSFTDVQVHAGPSAAAACEDINARAFTVGNHVAFNHGEYNPQSQEGQHVIAHELAHVRQQTQGAVSMLPQGGLDLEVEADPELEGEAEGTAQRVIEGDELGIQRLADTEIFIQQNPRQKRNADGTFGGIKEKFKAIGYEGTKKFRENRPHLPESVVKQVWEDSKNEDGIVICPVSDKKIDMGTR